MSTPTVLDPKIQRGAMDCGVVCLESLFPEKAVRETARKVAPRYVSHGLYLSELQTIAAKLGIRLVKKKARLVPDEGVGIVRVKLFAGGCHFVTLFHGLIANPSDGLVYTPDVYFANRGKALSVLMVEE
jgi:hypothetical protein